MISCIKRLVVAAWADTPAPLRTWVEHLIAFREADCLPARQFF